jgi:hypothetical protein
MPCWTASACVDKQATQLGHPEFSMWKTKALRVRPTHCDGVLAGPYLTYRQWVLQKSAKDLERGH